MKKVIYLQQFLNQLKGYNLTLFPCSEEEISNVSNGKVLPVAFIEFLENLGKGTEGRAKFMKGEDCYYERLLRLTDGAREILLENDSSLKLDENVFVFWMSQGCMFCFFELDKGDNPPVYLYSEAGEDRFIKISEKYTDFLMDYLNNESCLFDEI